MQVSQSDRLLWFLLVHVILGSLISSRTYEALFRWPGIGAIQSIDLLRLSNKRPCGAVPREQHTNVQVPQHHESGECGLGEEELYAFIHLAIG